MYLEVYPDIIFILNFFLDFFLLFLLTKVNRKSTNIYRLAGGACVGGAFAVFTAVFPWMNALLRFALMYVAASVLMIWILFGRLKIMDLWKQIIVFYLITYVVGGVINSIYYYTDAKLYLISLGKGLEFSNVSIMYIISILLVISPALLFVLWLLRWYGSNATQTYEVELVLLGHCIRTKGLMDSGNCLYDPIYKRPVMIMDNILAGELLSPEFSNDLKEARNYMERSIYDTQQWNISSEHLLRLRFVPYQSIGKAGMLVGINLDKVLIHTDKETICNEKVIVAISENCLSAREEYHVILHKGLMNQL